MPANPRKSAAAAKKDTPRVRKYSLGTVHGGIDLDLPSGNTCLARRPGIPGLMAAGVLDSMDSLTGLVYSKHVEGNSTAPKSRQTTDAEAIKGLASDPERIKSAVKMIDTVVAYCVIEPKVSLPAPPGEERESGMPVEDVDFDDKMFILQWAVGGVNDLATFRRESKELLDSLETE